MVRILKTSSQFVISCGTVTVDSQALKVLLIYSRETNEYLLPKGRKNVEETLEEAALRETLEETGYKATLLPLSIPTRATSASPSASSLVTEPVCMSQRETDGVLKVIFWFAAEADSSTVELERPRQPGEENYETVWMSFDEAKSKISFDDDREILKEVLKYTT